MSAERRPSLGSLDISSDGGGVENDLRNYTSRMEELFEDSGKSQHSAEDNGTDDEEGFSYSGVHADVKGEGYRDKLRDVLGAELSDDSGEEDLETEYALNSSHHEPLPPASPQTVDQAGVLDERLVDSNTTLDHTPSFLLHSSIDPSVSRLRSHPVTGLPSHADAPFPIEPSPSSLLSASISERTAAPSRQNEAPHSPNELEPLKWTELRSISDVVTKTLSQKLSAVLGAPLIGTPTVLTANGLICIGTNAAKICVFDFRQNLKVICGKDTPFKDLGAVTALALSYDQAFVASGHATGHIQVFDLKKPDRPIYTVAPTTPSIVASGRKEGHLEGSQIRRIGFITGRRTAIVSSDDQGLAFSHRFGKVLFIEASDILRILGKYPFADGGSREEARIPARSPAGNGPQTLDTSIRRRRRQVFPILDMAPLPLGTLPCATDQYNLIAMLTATKLVVVGLKPTPRTWFKCARNSQGTAFRSRLQTPGTLAWFPCTSEQMSVGNDHVTSAAPLLICTWGNQCHLIRIREQKVTQTLQDPHSGKIREVEVGTIAYENIKEWSIEEDILSTQWLNASQILLVTRTSLRVYNPTKAMLVDRVAFDSSELIRPSSVTTPMEGPASSSLSADIAHSVYCFKGKIFLLERTRVRAGTLLTWADKILTLVEGGDFLAAIEVAVSYYEGSAKGNMYTLPADPVARKDLVGDKVRSLMFASTRYAFSEQRMTDGTLASLGGRGVDRTDFFEQLVTVCVRACTAIDDYEFLFEDLFQQYDEAGIIGIYLHQIDRHMLDNTLRHVPPHVTQQVLESQKDDPAHIEHLICRIDPACLDINQSIRICQEHFLYDALIYVYMSTLHDYTAPIVELLELIKILRSTRESSPITDENRDKYLQSAAKIFPYLAATLTGRTYPNGERMAVEDTLQAQKDIYGFLFSGRTAVWPPGEGAKVILTSDEGGLEPTYPYARQLLNFDTEAFLHMLDIAFEDSHLNDESQGTSRLLVVRILLDILSSKQLPPHASTLINIFIARNVPKYPQFIQVAPSTLRAILVDLAEDEDESSREDRQLAAEYLLSAYSPDGIEELSELFHAAGFYRIIRRWHRHEKQWAALATTYLEDDTMAAAEKIQNLDDVLGSATKQNKGTLPPDLLHLVEASLTFLLKTSLTGCAVLLEKHIPQLHEQAVESLSQNGPHQLRYLRCLLFGEAQSDGPTIKPPPKHQAHISTPLRQLFLDLLCRHSPDQFIPTFEQLPLNFLPLKAIIATCENHELYYASIWAINQAGQTTPAWSKFDSYSRLLVTGLMGKFTPGSSPPTMSLQKYVTSLQHLTEMGIQACVNRSRASHISSNHEDDWFRLLSTEMTCVQTFSASTQEIEDNTGAREFALRTLRGLVETTFSAMTNTSPVEVAILPSLFSRLVDSAPATTGTQYSELRMVLDTILDSFRWDADMLTTVKELVHQDLFQAIADVATERKKGWTAARSTCANCRHPLLDNTEPNGTAGGIIVSRTGALHHQVCPVK